MNSPVEKKRRRRIWPYLIAAAIPLLGLVAFYLLAARTTVLASVNRGFSRPVLDAMGSHFAAVPFSFMEFYIALLLVAVLLFLISLFRRLILGPARLKSLLRHILVLITVAALVWNGFCWLWNAGYYDDSFSKASGMDARGAYLEQLEQTAVFFLDEANALADQVPRDADGVMILSWDRALEGYDRLYDSLEQDYPCLRGQTTKPKRVFFSSIMSRLGFTGIFFPFTGETYVNGHQPAWSMPFSVAHEIAHQRGVHLEAECDFLGIAACLQSDDPCVRYSGCLMGLIHMSNALYRADPDSWYRIRAGFSKGTEADWKYNSDYWKKMEGTVSKASDKVYDSFLKVNTQPSGLRSYGECVDLLVLWLNENGYIPAG